MNTLKLFSFNNTQVRVHINDNNEPEFCALDVTNILGYSNGRDAISKHCKSRGVAKRDIPSKSGIQSYTFIDEGNLYRLIVKSNMPESEKFESWIFDEVLPSIRKHGAYMTESIVEQALADPDSVIKLLLNLKEERRQREIAQETVQLQQKELQKAAPKVEYYDDVLQADNCHTTTTIAKELGMSAKTLNNELHKKGIQFFQDGHWILYHKYQSMGYAKTRTHKYEVIEEGKTVIKTNVSTVWTEKGREFIHKVMKELKAA